MQQQKQARRAEHKKKFIEFSKENNRIIHHSTQLLSILDNLKQHTTKIPFFCDIKK